MKKLIGCLTVLLSTAAAFAANAPKRDTRVYVDGPRVQGLREFGGAKAMPQEKWTDFFSADGSFKPRWSTDASVGAGHFCLKARMSISHQNFCEAAIRIGSGDRELIVYLEGINGLFSIMGPFVKADAETGRVRAAKGKIRQDKPFDLTIQRVGDQLEVYIDGELMRRQWVSDGAIGPASIVPVRGRLHIERFEVTANFVPFEMGKLTPVWELCKVRALAPLKTRDAGFPLGPFVNLKDGSVLTVVGTEAWVSADEGKTWRKHPMFRDTKRFRTIPEHAAVCLKSGVVVVHFVNVGEQHYSWDIQRNRPNPDNRQPTYSVRSLDNGKTWEEPVKIVDDYSGCMRSVIQLRDGTLVSMVQRLNFPEGRNYSQPFWSADEGRTWHAADVMDCGKEHGDHSGLIEATLVELKDGRVWTLLRSYHGYFYEAFSSDSGRTWSPIPPRPSKIKSTGSPGSLLRMSDGSIMLIHNAIPTEGYERREELSVQFSDDEGGTWTKPLIIAKCPGARVAYPYVLERRPGELWISAMQGDLKTTTTLKELRTAAENRD